MPFRFLWHDIAASHFQGICCKHRSSVLSSASVFESVQAIKMLHEKDEVFYIAYSSFWQLSDCKLWDVLWNYFFKLHLTFFSPMIMCLKAVSAMIFGGHWRIDWKKRKNVVVGNLAKTVLKALGPCLLHSCLLAMPAVSTNQSIDDR